MSKIRTFTPVKTDLVNGDLAVVERFPMTGLSAQRAEEIAADAYGEDGEIEDETTGLRYVSAFEALNLPNQGL